MRKWLQSLVDQYLPAVEQLQDAPKDLALATEWANWMRQQWAEHGLAALKQQRNLMTDVRSAIKSRLGEEHVALKSMNFTMAEWTIINTPIEEQVARRNENVVLLDHPDAIVAQAVRLLESREWAEVAAGLVVLTGRRSSEILGTADFQPKSQWSVVFSGALKRRGEAQVLSFEIPTLTTAERAIAALAKLRLVCPTTGLSAEQINQKYSQAVATACDRHFSQLVPNRDGRDHLFSHLFRSVYAAIATFWYAPSNVDANEYKAAIQGHYAFLDADSSLKRSLAASRHYNDYKIGDRAGNIDGRQGIKLGYGGVEVIEVFRRSRRSPIAAIASAKEEQQSEKQQSEKQQFIEGENTAMASIRERACDGEQQFFESISQALEALPVVARTEPETNDAQGVKRRVTRRMKSVSVDLDRLKGAAEKLGIEILRGKGKGYDLALSEILLRLEQGAVISEAAMPNVVEVDERSLQPIAEPVTPISQTVADQAKTLVWLTGRVEALEADLASTKQEKEAAIMANLALSAQQHTDSANSHADLLLQQKVEQLHHENEQLNEELQQTRSRLEGIQKFLSGDAARTTLAQVSEPERATVSFAKQHSPQLEQTPGAVEKLVSTPAIPLPKVAQARRSPGELYPDALKALNAILDYNDSVATSHQERWTISIPVMKDLLKQVGKASQPKIEAVLKAKLEAIAQHHRTHGLGERHNRVHQGQSISDVIRL